MGNVPGAGQRVSAEVASWPGVDAGAGPRGELAFRVHGREIGHLHGDHAVHYFFPKDIWLELHEEGRIAEHPVFPGRQGPAAHAIEDEADVREVIELLRLNYDHVLARRLARSGAAARRAAVAAATEG